MSDVERGMQGEALDTVRSLSDLFALLPSPAPVAQEPQGDADYKAQVVEALLANDESTEELTPIPALQTRLHPYQRKTVAHMLQREFDTSQGPNSKGAVYGGILCEEMGTGKTLECLALILATCGSMPQVASELSQTQQFTEEIDQASQSGCPTLASLCVKAIRSSAYPIQWWKEPALQNHPLLTRQLKHAAPFYSKAAPGLPRHATLSRAPEDLFAQESRIYMSAATIIVVPATLISHWLDEIKKHIRPDARASLRTLVIESAQNIPTASEMAQAWDIILLSYDHFSREASRRPSRPSTTSRRACQCTYVGSSRTVVCQCQDLQDIENTPLLSCRFKRLIVDEGNKLAGQSRLVDLASQLNAENRWIVSGTPTEALVGTGDDDWSAVEQAKTSGRAQVSRPRPRSAWTKEEKKDVDERLYKLLVEFLHMPPYYNADRLNYGLSPTETSRKKWNADVVRPLFPSKHDPPPADALRLLFDLLSACMVRNRPEDVAKDRPLPPLRRHYIALHLSTVERKTFNVIQALISANAVLSEQSDEDYFFHPSNRRWLLEIIGNLWLACFHFASPERVEHASEAIKLVERKVSTEGKWRHNDDLKLALHHLQQAMNDPQWLNQGQEVDYKVSSLPVSLHRAWRRADSTADTMLNAAEIFDLQKGLDSVLSKQTFTGAMASVEDAEEEVLEDLITSGEKSKREFWASQSHTTSAKKKSPTGKGKGRSGHHDAVPHTSGPDLTPNNQLRSRGGAIGSSQQHVRLPPNSRLLDTALSGCTSTKVSAIVSLLCTPTPVPTLLFSSLSNTLFELSYIFDILSRSYPHHFSHRIFASGVQQKRLDEYISLFKSGSINLLLLKIDRGGRGLDLHRARRVIFLEPEMRAGLERQAVKRAWRQGQEHPVDAYYMYVRGTFEEKMAERMKERHGALVSHAKQEENEDTPHAMESKASSASEGSIACMLRDPVMREFVAHPRYVQPPTAEDEERDAISPIHSRKWALSVFAGHAGEEAQTAAVELLSSTAAEEGGRHDELRARLRPLSEHRDEHAHTEPEPEPEPEPDSAIEFAPNEHDDVKPTIEPEEESEDQLDELAPSLTMDVDSQAGNMSDTSSLATPPLPVRRDWVPSPSLDGGVLNGEADDATLQIKHEDDEHLFAALHPDSPFATHGRRSTVKTEDPQRSDADVEGSGPVDEAVVPRPAGTIRANEQSEPPPAFFRHESGDASSSSDVAILVHRGTCRDASTADGRDAPTAKRVKFA